MSFAPMAASSRIDRGPLPVKNYLIWTIFQGDIGVEWPIPFCPWLTEKVAREKKIVVGHYTQPVQQERPTITSAVFSWPI